MYQTLWRLLLDFYTNVLSTKIQDHLESLAMNLIPSVKVLLIIDAQHAACRRCQWIWLRRIRATSWQLRGQLSFLRKVMREVRKGTRRSLRDPKKGAGPDRAAAKHACPHAHARRSRKPPRDDNPRRHVQPLRSLLAQPTASRPGFITPRRR